MSVPFFIGQNIADATFRANPEYELVHFDHLAREQQEVLASLKKDPNLYGILRPRNQRGLAIKSISRDIARLLLELQRPGRLPNHVRVTLGDRYEQVVGALVLDGVFEVEQNGVFVSGPHACSPGVLECEGSAGAGIIADLSIDALKYAQALEIADITKLSARIYFYNRLPVSSRWKQRFPTEGAVVEYLGIRSHRPTRELLEHSWSSVASTSPFFKGWMMWKSRNAEHRLPRNGPRFKLYVSPQCEVAREAFEGTVEILSESTAAQFKVGNDVYGLLRPDKIVAYFSGLPDLEEVAKSLAQRLVGVPPHGVPFTAEIAGDGLISWGIDPPRDQQVLAWQERESWRLWITNQLATGLLMARGYEPGPVEPWQFALECLRLRGVDTRFWRPLGDLGWSSVPVEDE
jgi:hypothetical protein